MAIILGANSAVSGAYEVANSCRFEDNAYMHKTPGSAGNVDTWTFSCWIKRTKLGETELLNAYTSTTNYTRLMFDSNNKLAYDDYQGSQTAHHVSNAIYRDTSAWYNIVCAVDTTDGTGGDRVKLWVNGTRVTSFATDDQYTQNQDTRINEDIYTTINQLQNGNATAGGYMAEVCLIDGSQLAATSFGEFNSDSPTIWQPIDVSGLTFGTNGFYLDFEASDNLGNDANGGTDLTEVNLAATDQTTDTPTNSFATLNSLVNFNSGVFSEGNCAITFGDDTISTIGVTKGRWYWEAQRTNSTTEAHFGIGVSNGFYSATSIVSDGDRLYTRSGATFFSTASNLGILTFGSNGGTSAAVASGDVIGFYLDLESGTKNITIKKNDGGTPIVDVDLTYSGAEPIFAFCRMNSGCASSWNFGNPIAALSSANADDDGYGSFEFSPTLGGTKYYALCTKNLAEYG